MPDAHVTPPDELLTYWFGDWNDASTLDRADPRFKRWFSATPEIDADVRTRFGALHTRAAAGELDAPWSSSPRARLALVIALDQLPRHLFRGSSKAFATDSAALVHARAAIDDGASDQLQLIERMFLHLPLSHAEELATQRRAVELASALVELAKTRSPANVAFFDDALRSVRWHCTIIERFARFPHRNVALGRTFTADEIEFLKSPEGAHPP